jgi:hypothetical protein
MSLSAVRQCHGTRIALRFSVEAGVYSFVLCVHGEL